MGWLNFCIRSFLPRDGQMELADHGEGFNAGPMTKNNALFPTRGDTRKIASKSESSRKGTVVQTFQKVICNCVFHLPDTSSRP